MHDEKIIQPEVQEEPFKVELDMAIDLSSDQINTIASGAADLWVFGSLEYEDFLDCNHEKRFCCRWTKDPHNSSHYYFVADDTAPINYRKGEPKKKKS